MRLSVVLLVFLCACKSKPAAPPEPPPSTAIDLMAQLDKESKQRPTGTPTAEAVFEALQHANISVDRQKQVVAMNLGALYCAAGFLPSESAVVVCEYADEDAAKQGREQALKLKPKGPRWIFVNKKTALTVTARGEGSADALAKKLEELFAAL